MKERRAHAERITDAIRDVLVRDWDPIGVMDDAEWPRDEYDSYIGGVYSRLVRGESAELIAKHLCAIEKSAMGLGEVPASLRLPVALKLKAIDVSPQAQPADRAGGA
jgi:hypothetical protein